MTVPTSPKAPLAPARVEPDPGTIAQNLPAVQGTLHFLSEFLPPVLLAATRADAAFNVWGVACAALGEARAGIFVSSVEEGASALHALVRLGVQEALPAVWALERAAANAPAAGLLQLRLTPVQLALAAAQAAAGLPAAAAAPQEAPLVVRLASSGRVGAGDLVRLVRELAQGGDALRAAQVLGAAYPAMALGAAVAVLDGTARLEYAGSTVVVHAGQPRAA